MIYMTPEQAGSRLSSRYNVTASLTIGDVMLASEALRDMEPMTDDVDLNEEMSALPDALLDWVALKAYQLSGKDEPPVQSEGVGGAQITYTRPYTGQTERRMQRLIAPYLKRRGTVA